VKRREFITLLGGAAVAGYGPSDGGVLDEHSALQ
jgi:hypothetical protein